jgi:hypothetical protein
LTEDDAYDYLMFFSSSRDYLPTSLLKALARTSLLFIGFDASGQDGRTLWHSLQSLRHQRVLMRNNLNVIKMGPEENDPHRGKRSLWWQRQGSFQEYEGSVTDFLQDLALHLKSD